MAKVSKDLIRERKFLERKIKALMAEYDVKVTYDFSRYIIVGVKENYNIILEEAIDLITTCAGYEAHKLVLYKHAIGTNMYVRFADQNYAMAAAERLRQQEGYCVDMVRAMLVSWYLEEMLKGNFPWTLALVSIEGRPEHTNPLSQDILQGMLMQFGDPKISTYQIGNHVEHVQVLFSSLSEALGASIAHGCWFRGIATQESPRFFYNIKILGTEKETKLLRSIQLDKLEANQEPEALEMDYFVQKIEIKMPSYMEESPYLSNSPTQTISQDSRNSPKVREFRRQFSRGRGNNERGRRSNYQWTYENRSTPKRFQNYASRITLQDFTNF